jgi:hypothetical protein
MISTGSGAAELSRFCEKRVVHDYERPLNSLPKLRAIPEHPSFAPRNTSLDGSANAILVLEDGEAGRVGYGFTAPDSDRRVSLHWTVAGQAAQVNAKGEEIRPLARVRRRVGVVDVAALNDLYLSFRIPSDPGLYRVDLVFRGKERKLLGRYGQYFRVVRPTVSVGLAASPAIAHRGEDVNVRVLNFGTVSVGYGTPFSVEQFDGTGWIRYPWNQRWTRPLFRLGGGQAGFCQTFPVPEDMPPGVYRFRKGLSNPSMSLTTAPFEVAL